MYRNVAVLSSAILAAASGMALASSPQLVKSSLTPTRIDPVGIAPIYVIDGVEVIGDSIPYSTIRPAMAGRRVVFDQYEGDDTVAGDYPPVDRGGPCGGAGFLYTANTDSASTDYFRVNICHSTDDYKGMDPFGIGKPVTGCALMWYHTLSPMVWVIRAAEEFNEANDPNWGTSTGRGRTYRGVQHIGVVVYYSPTDAPVASGLYYSYVDWAGAIVQAALVDTDGAVNFAFYTSHTAINNANLNPNAQVASWGTRTDELPAPMSSARPGGQMNPFWYIDDAAALHSDPYVFANAISDGLISVAGAGGGPNETYSTGPSTDPVDCFRSTGICWALFVQECIAQDAATLVAPADNAVGITNVGIGGPSFEWAPGTVIASDYTCNIYLANVLVYAMPGILTTNFDLGIALTDCETYEWSMVSNAGDPCPGAESGRFTFTMAAGATPCCPADFNGDTVVDFFDYLDFVDAFSANDPSADFNGDTVIDFFDYLDFVDAFSTGC